MKQCIHIFKKGTILHDLFLLYQVTPSKSKQTNRIKQVEKSSRVRHINSLRINIALIRIFLICVLLYRNNLIAKAFPQVIHPMQLRAVARQGVSELSKSKFQCHFQYRKKINKKNVQPPFASANICRSICRCSGLVVFLMPSDWATKRFAKVAEVAGRGLENKSSCYRYAAKQPRTFLTSILILT